MELETIIFLNKLLSQNPEAFYKNYFNKYEVDRLQTMYDEFEEPKGHCSQNIKESALLVSSFLLDRCLIQEILVEEIRATESSNEVVFNNLIIFASYFLIMF